jgi:hypothetical protein
MQASERISVMLPLSASKDDRGDRRKLMKIAALMMHAMKIVQNPTSCMALSEV